MPYIGNPLQSTNFVTDIFTGDAVTTAFTLSRPPASVVSIIIFIDGVKQSSSGTYTLSGATLNFTAAPPNNAVIEVIHLGVQSLVNVPSLLSVTASSLADGAVTGPKIGLTAINANNIVNGTITGAKIALGTITGDDIAVNQITGNLLTNTSISSNNLVDSITIANTTTSNIANFLGPIFEKANVVTTGGLTANVTISTTGPGILVYTANSAANATINFTGLSSMTVGNVASYVFMVTNNTAPKYVSNVQIDGTDIIPRWSGGAPTTGTSANTDIYSFNIVKTSATPTYNVFAQVSSFF